MNNRNHKGRTGNLNNEINDLLRYLFGELEIIAKTKLHSPSGRICILESENKDKIDLLMNWNSPSNFSLNIEANGSRLELKPFETVKLFKGMNIIEPTDDLPLRRYIPKVVEESSSFPSKKSNFKPGFVEQALEMKSILDGNEPKISASLIDAYKVQEITQSILFD